MAGLDQVMEGAHRPGHFDGVATVVARFLEIVKPHRAYFGKKDFQQLGIIRKVCQVKRLPVEIVAHPIERNSKGLALSSRNQLLSEERQNQALIIYNSLRWARQNYHSHSPSQLKERIRQDFATSPLELEYVEISNSRNLQPITGWDGTVHARIFIAAKIADIRLIDNLSLF
ncbi:MAG: pantoate--beta-alanine ligase [Owenweeksia sp.]|nr:pantoate--beta-alanine ligase [Owenweeksia sp.]